MLNLIWENFLKAVRSILSYRLKLMRKQQQMNLKHTLVEVLKRLIIQELKRVDI